MQLKSVTIEAVDYAYQIKMMEMLKQTGRPEAVVGWYHSHPGYGCWLSGTDLNTQRSFEKSSPRCIAVVIDPVQSVKGKVREFKFFYIIPTIFIRYLIAQ